MSEDEALRRLISNDLDTSAAGNGEPEKMLAAMHAGRRKQHLWRLLVVLAALIGTLSVLSIGYLLAAQVLPPFGDSGAATLLWWPLGAIGALVACAAWIAVATLFQARR